MSEQQAESKPIFSGQRQFGMIDCFIWIVFLLYFRLAIVWIFTTFRDAAFYEYGLAFGLMVVIIAALLYKKRAVLREKFYFSFSSLPIFLLFVAILVDFINTLFFHYNIISAIAFLIGLYGLSGLYLEKKFWRRGIFLLLILIFTLPFLEDIQTFLGFPLRLLSANIVSFLLQTMHVSHVSESTVIMIENNATSIDLPCSGVKSIYSGSLFLFAFFALKNVRISWRAVAISGAFFLALIFFNTWRVFSLVYINDVLHMQEFGDAIHVSMGIIGFVASCILLVSLEHYWNISKPHTS